VTGLDFVAVPSTDWKRAGAFFEAPDGDALMLYHRYKPREQGRTDA
jgi:hypothetical protein